MLISLKSDSEFKPFRIYSVNQKNKNVIDKTFDKFHDQDKMQ